MLIKESKTNWKYILIVAILAVIVGGGILWVMKQEMPFIELLKIEKPEVVEDRADNWEVYRNEEYGFEIKYPKGWTTQEEVEENLGETIKKKYRLDIFHPENITEAYIYGDVTVEFFVYDDNDKSFKQLLDLMRRDLTLTIEEITIDGVKGFKGTAHQQEYKAKSMYILEIFPDKEDKGIFRILVWTIDVGEGTYQEQTKLILSTFKFIEVDETADWQTYRNEEYGYEVKYPADTWKLGRFGRDFRKGEREFDVLHTKLLWQAEQVEAGETIRWNEPMAFIGWNKGPVNGEDWKTYSLKDWLNTWCDEKFEEGSTKKVGSNNEYEAAQCEQDVICEFGYCYSSLRILIQQPNTSTKLLFWVTVAEIFTAEEIKRNKETYFPIYQRILSTFKFIEVDETADWQTYRNEEYGYEVKYPADYIANTDNPMRVYFEPSEFVFIEGPFPTIEIINKSPEEQKESLKQQYLISESPFTKIIEREDIIVNNLRGKDMIFMAETGIETRYILLFYKGKTYQLKADYVLKIQTVFNQMLSTFRFLD